MEAVVVGSHPEAVHGEVVSVVEAEEDSLLVAVEDSPPVVVVEAVEEEVAAAHVAVEEAEVEWEQERKLLLSPTDMRECLYPGERRMLCSLRTWLSESLYTVKKGSLLKTRLERLNTEYGIRSDLSLPPPFSAELTRFTCLLAVKFYIWEPPVEPQSRMYPMWLGPRAWFMLLNSHTDPEGKINLQLIVNK